MFTAGRHCEESASHGFELSSQQAEVIESLTFYPLSYRATQSLDKLKVLKLKHWQASMILL